MRQLLIIMLAIGLWACENSQQSGATKLLEQASTQFEQGRYDRALVTIDSLRKVYPNAIETRRQALKLYQDIELKRSQEELALVDSALQVVKRDYEQLRARVEADKQDLRATPGELTLLTRTRVRRDSLQTRFDVLCGKIRYIHKKQKE